MKLMRKLSSLMLIFLIIINIITINSNKKTQFFSNYSSAANTKTHMLMSLKLSYKNLENFSILERMGGYPPAYLDSADIGEGPIYCHGWEKYMKTGNFNKKKFALNPKNNKESFYFIVTEKTVAAFQSEETKEDDNSDAIMIKDLLPIEQASANLKGGVQDVGNFKEGFCYELKGKRNGGAFKWIICSDSYQEKSKFVNCITKLKMKMDAQNPIKRELLSVKTNLKLFSNNPAITSNSKKEGINNGFRGYGKDGKRVQNKKRPSPQSKWILLKDWSECTLACGGGKQFKQRMCFKPAGAPLCIGEPILEKPCNTHLCNAYDILNKGVTNPAVEEKILPPQIKIVQITSRKQRFVKCKIKEEDMNIIRKDNNMDALKIPFSFPSRIIMNLHTFSVYEGETSDSIYKSFNLKDIKLVREYEKDPEKCLEVGYTKHYIVICALVNGRKEPRKVIDDWIRDIHDFQHNCVKKVPVGKKIKHKNIYESPEVQNFIAILQQRKMEKNLRIIKQKEKEEAFDKFGKQVKLAQVIAWKALDKEMRYESRMEKEEVLKEEDEREEVHSQLIKEQHKRDFLNKALCLGPGNNAKSKEFKQKLQMKRQLQQIRDEIETKIKNNRKALEARIHRMKMSHQRRLVKTRQQINDIRMSLASNVITAEKKGEMKMCKPKSDQSYRDAYCDKHFINDFYNNSDCKKEKEFCFICCETEFGDLLADERELCTTRCEVKSNKTKH